MATRKVPEQYSTIQKAISASSSGDVIIVKGGTYTENLSFTSSLRIRAVYGERVVLNGNIVIGTGSSIRGFDIVYNGSSYAIGASSAKVMCIVDCTITNGGSGYGIYNMGISGSISIVSRCTFFSSTTSNRAIYSPNGNNFIESCIFYNWVVSGDAVLRLVGTSSSNRQRVFNCVFRDCSSSTGAIIRFEGSGSNYGYVANCIFQACSTSTNYVIHFVAGFIKIVANCCYYNNSGTALFNSASDLGGHITTDPLLNDDNALSEGSPCILAGNTTYKANKDYGGKAFTDATPDIGAFRFLAGHVNAMYLTRHLVNISTGIDISVLATSGTIPTDLYSFNSPWEICEYIETWLTDNGNFAFTDFQLLWEVSNKYRMLCLSNMTYTFTSSIFGTSSGVTTDTG